MSGNGWIEVRVSESRITQITKVGCLNRGLHRLRRLHREEFFGVRMVFFSESWIMGEGGFGVWFVVCATDYADEELSERSLDGWMGMSSIMGETTN